MATLTIPDAFYTEAADAIAKIRSVNEANIVPKDIEKVLRSYVYLGVNKKIDDWTYLLNEAAKDVIVKAVQDITNQQYRFRPNYGRTWTNLDIAEVLASRGEVSPNIARPRAAQIRFEQNIREAPPLPNPIFEGIKNFFQFAVKTPLESALKGLGIDLPIETILIVLAVVLFMIVTRPVSS